MPGREIGHDRGEIPLRLRVGISGHRAIGYDHPEAASILDEVLTAISGFQASLRDRFPATPVGLVAVSALAEGADRLLARAVLDLDGGQLEAILPLGPDDYRDDFRSDDSKREFDALRGMAASVDIVQPAPSREHAYEAAGHAIVDRSDVMIFIWDGQPARGRGGTGDIYEYATSAGTAIIWIRVDDCSAVMAEQSADLMNSVLASIVDLDRYNSAGWAPSAVTAAEADDIIMTTAMPDTGNLVAAHFTRYFLRADMQAGRYQRRWFWATRMLYSLAALAVFAVASQLIFAPSHENYAWIEFVILAFVSAMLLVMRRAAWHDCWISFRYLAEQIRSHLFLALSGITSLADAGHSDTWLVAPATEPEWVRRALAEIWWTRPRYDLTADPELLRAIFLGDWIEKQYRYHVKTSSKYQDRSLLFSRIAIALFILSTAAALLHSLGAESWLVRPYRLLDLFSIVIPAVGAAFSGYAAQRDYMRHSGRSKLFAATLVEANRQFQRTTDVPGIQELGQGLSRLTASETADWYSAVSARDIDAPA